MSLRLLVMGSTAGKMHDNLLAGARGTDSVVNDRHVRLQERDYRYATTHHSLER